MKLELEKAKSKRKPRSAVRHPHIRGRYVEFDVDVMQQPTPSEGSDDRSEGQAEPDEFQDATENPSTVSRHPSDRQEGDASGEPRDQTSQNTDRTETQNGERHQEESQEGPGRGSEPGPMNGDRVVEDQEAEQNLDIHQHPEGQPIDGPAESDSEEPDDGEWNPVCVACLRVYSRDPDLTITLVSPEEKQGASSLVTGQEPAGATM